MRETIRVFVKERERLCVRERVRERQYVCERERLCVCAQSHVSCLKFSPESSTDLFVMHPFFCPALSDALLHYIYISLCVYLPKNTHEQKHRKIDGGSKNNILPPAIHPYTKTSLAITNFYHKTPQLVSE